MATMATKFRKNRIVRAIRFLLSREKNSRRATSSIEYGFKVLEKKPYTMIVLVTKNDLPYCQFDSSEAKFYDEHHDEIKSISNDEKCFIWKLINEFQENIDEFTFIREQ